MKYKIHSVYHATSTASVLELVLQPWLAALLLTLTTSAVLVVVGIAAVADNTVIEASLFIHILGLMLDLSLGESPGRGMHAAIVSLQFVLWDVQASVPVVWRVVGGLCTAAYVVLAVLTKWSQRPRAARATPSYKPVPTPSAITDFML